MDKKYLLPSSLKQDPLGGLVVTAVDDRMILVSIKESNPFAKLPRWRSRLRGAWLIRIDDTPITSMGDIVRALASSGDKPGSQCILLFSHPEV